jgi:hypothetical protein
MVSLMGTIERNRGKLDRVYRNRTFDKIKIQGKNKESALEFF